MRKSNITKIVTIMAVLAMVGFGLNVYAGQGKKYQRGQKGYQGGGCPGYGANLSEEEYQQLAAERQAFFAATEDLRYSIYAKRAELKSVVAQKDADLQQATEVQGALSALQAQLDQKRLEHMFKMKAINPYAGRGMHFKGGRGQCYGQSEDGWKRKGSRRGGGCRNQAPVM